MPVLSPSQHLHIWVVLSSMSQVFWFDSNYKSVSFNYNWWRIELTLKDIKTWKLYHLWFIGNVFGMTLCEAILSREIMKSCENAINEFTRFFFMKAPTKQLQNFQHSTIHKNAQIVKKKNFPYFSFSHIFNRKIKNFNRKTVEFYLFFHLN